MEYQSFDNSEEELLYFVKSFYNKTWDWKVQYKDDMQKDADEEQRRQMEQKKLFSSFFAFDQHDLSIIYNNIFCFSKL